jgi:hypothetical protein
VPAALDMRGVEGAGEPFDHLRERHGLIGGDHALRCRRGNRGHRRREIGDIGDRRQGRIDRPAATRPAPVPPVFCRSISGIAHLLRPAAWAPSIRHDRMRLRQLDRRSRQPSPSRGEIIGISQREKPFKPPDAPMARNAAPSRSAATAASTLTLGEPETARRAGSGSPSSSSTTPPGYDATHGSAFWRTRCLLMV